MIGAITFRDENKMNNGNKPLVSIGMPVYNGEKLVSQAIESLLAQDFEDFQLLISDNASTDLTGELCKEYAERDKRIIYQRNKKNLGAVANFNKVAYMAQGKYFMWASHDDLWEPSYISCLIRPLIESPSVVLAYPKVLAIAPGGTNCWEENDEIDTIGIKSPSERVRKVHKGVVRREAIYGLMPRDAVVRALPIPSVRGSDHVFLALIAILGEFAYIPERLFTYRMQETPKWRWKERYIHYQVPCEPDAAKPKKFNTFWPTAASIYQRVLHEDLDPASKIRICVDTFYWCIRMERERLRPFTEPERWKRRISELLSSLYHKYRGNNTNDS